MLTDSEPEIIVEHDVKKERTVTGFYWLLGTVIAVQLLGWLLIENIVADDQPQPKGKIYHAIPDFGIDTYFKSDPQPWPYGIKPKN